MKNMMTRFLFAEILLATAILAGCAKSDSTSVNLARERQPGARQYLSETDFISHAPDGTILGKDNLTMRVEVTRSAEGKQTLRCLEFSHTAPGGIQHTIPALAGWTHELPKGETPEVLGIRQGDFTALKYENGQPLPPETGYRVYNTFVDFYAFNNVFAENAPGTDGKNIGALKTPGQTVIHYSANSKPSLTLGDAVKEGSYFQNGEVTLQLKGWSEVNGNPCTLVGFDSGDSSFVMGMEPAPGMNMKIKGGSRYWGEMYINSKTFWLEESNFREIVLTEIRIRDNAPIASVAVRVGQIRSVD
jgi:hypothetical protein